MQSKKTEYTLRNRVLLSAVFVLLGAVLFSSKVLAVSNYTDTFGTSYLAPCQKTGINFTASSNETASYLNSYGSKESTSTQNLIIKIFKSSGNIPTGTALATGTIDTSNLQTTSAMLVAGTTATTSISLSNRVSFVSGQSYIITYESSLTGDACPNDGTFFYGYRIGLNASYCQVAYTGGAWSPVCASPSTIQKFSTSEEYDQRQTHNLAFTEPTQDAKVLSPPSFVGTCDSSYTPLTLQIIPEPCYFGTSNCNEQSNYKDIIISPISCIGNTWTYSGVTLTPLRYEAKIEDNSYATATVDFWVTNINGWLGPGSTAGFSNGTSTPKCSNIVNWSCSNALIGDVCANGATVVNDVACFTYSTLAAQENAFQHTKPYSWAWQLYDAYQSLSVPTTTTSTLPTLAVKLGTATTTFFSQSSLINQNTEPVLLALRPYFVLLIQLSFLGFIILWFIL